ncbi:phosphatidylserine/phosphatidylglycerophosphate/cardiolipin synthase family protein [Bacillus cereus]|uniref:Phosphatidylserine/phosphatidylglycerophosphate/ cardiolipin synthase family protein n=1 Tax=Bacillus cereus TaxID=1396 RepID=A0A9X8NV40_BACCE|nr:phosphatidylserine/phosphatidylglycerophosphate/cardiolipin synthase family protein [Bacillus cereus]RWQ73139.1 phosphatidylserine/phosphatidylglycerophosphate/cardiolipin synthase family protein [Bacillus cereus]
MKQKVSNVTGEIILSYQENGYQVVLDEFQHAKCINIVTYNINTYERYSVLIKELRKLNKSTKITIILNIPDGSYLKNTKKNKQENNINNVIKKIKNALSVLEHEKFGSLEVYVNLENHAKLIMTDTIAYIGSQNFSDASEGKFELGFLVKDPKVIRDIENNIFAEIKSKSIHCITSEYRATMEEIAVNMGNKLQNIREDILTWVGDPPFIPWQEVFFIDDAYFHRERWGEFKEFHSEFEVITEKLIDEYPSEFNKESARETIKHLRKLVKLLVSELDELANFKTNQRESMMWDKFHELDSGENMEEALEDAQYYVENYKEENYREIEDKGKELIKIFDYIKESIRDIETIVDEIKDAMIRKALNQNIERILQDIKKQ